MKKANTVPYYEGEGFNCPHCDAYAHQHWWKAIARSDEGTTNIPGLTLAICEKCNDYSL